MSNLLPIADGAELRRRRSELARPAPRGADRRRRSCTRSPPRPGSRARRSSARSCSRCRRDDRPAHVDQMIVVLLASSSRADDPHVLRAARVVRALRADVRRAARGLHAPRARAAALDRRARRHRRPRLAHDRRRRRAHAHDPLRRCPRRRSPRHRAARRSPPRSGSARSPRCRASSACRCSGLGTRWYLRTRPAGYLWERATYATLAGTVGETVDGGRTVEALGLRRAARPADRRRPAPTPTAAERRTLYLRTIWFPTAEFAYVLPVVAALAWGGWLVANGHASLGEVTAVVALRRAARRPRRPADLVARRDPGRRDLVRAARRHRRRAARPHGDRRGRPTTSGCARTTCATPTSPDRDVLHGIDLDLEPGERVAVVGPSGAGKSTLGRLLAGIHPPRAGRVDVGGVPLVDLPLETLRREVALVTQEQHVFVGTLDENLRLARPGATRRRSCAPRSTAVDAHDWAEALPDGLDTVVGAGGVPLTPAQAQQLALARLVLADPHTLVLDEATSLLDPRAARHLERSLASVLDGPHRRRDRPPAAHGARRRPRRGGRGRPARRRSARTTSSSNGGGSYAALWDSWHSER